LRPTDRLSTLKQARRERLLDVAEAVFVAAEFRATTMQEIAQRAGMSKVTLYSHITEKEAVFVAVGQRLGNQILGAVNAELDGDSYQCALIMTHVPTGASRWT
jgi:AcrR family transcriptional regulator